MSIKEEVRKISTRLFDLVEKEIPETVTNAQGTWELSTIDNDYAYYSLGSFITDVPNAVIGKAPKKALNLNRKKLKIKHPKYIVELAKIVDKLGTMSFKD